MKSKKRRKGVDLIKPVIGITTFCQKENKANKSYDKVSCNYIKAVSQAGGLPLPIPISNKTENVDRYIELLDGLILSGGSDISPLKYGEEVMNKVGEIDYTRDSWEDRLFIKAYEKDLPILGICRGMQLINVVLGGTLYQDLTTDLDEVTVSHLSKKFSLGRLHHPVIVTKNSRLYEILGKPQIDVNSYHHQGIKVLGESLEVNAESQAGVIEGIESEVKDFVIGVQWHPEDLVESHPMFSTIFTELVKEAMKQ